MRGQVFGRQAVLAREFVQAAEAAFEFVELRRVEVEIGAHAVEQDRGLVELDRRRVEHGVDLEQAGFVRLQPRQAAAQLLELRGQGAGIVAGEAGERGVARRDQAGGVGVAAVRGAELGDGLRRELLAVELVDLVLQPLDALGDVAYRAQAVAFAQQRAPVAGGGADPGQRRVVAAEGVEQHQLAAAGEQRLVLVLAVDLHQQPGEFAQLRDRRGAAVDPGPRAAVGAQGAPQLAGDAVVEILFAQPGQGLRTALQVELRVQLGARGAVTDHAAVRALPGQEAERVDQQRLAGAGLAGHHGQADAELELGGGDDGEILDREASEHGARLCRADPQPAIVRSRGLRREPPGLIPGPCQNAPTSPSIPARASCCAP